VDSEPQWYWSRGAQIATEPTLMWNRRRDKDNALVEGVIAEAEGLLMGGWTDRYGWRDRPVLTVVSSLAHCGRDDLLKIRAACPLGYPARWEGPVQYLAGRLLAVTRTGPDLVRLQRQVLIPLELQLLGDEIRRPSTPAHLVTMVMAALDRYHIQPDP
jgi:hypothetical protein